MARERVGPYRGVVVLIVTAALLAGCVVGEAGAAGRRVHTGVHTGDDTHQTTWFDGLLEQLGAVSPESSAELQAPRNDPKRAPRKRRVPDCELRILPRPPVSTRIVTLPGPPAPWVVARRTGPDIDIRCGDRILTVRAHQGRVDPELPPTADPCWAETRGEDYQTFAVSSGQTCSHDPERGWSCAPR